MLLQTALLCCLVTGLQAASSKRGVCMGFRTYFCGDSNALTGSTWWYDWGRLHNEHTQHHCTNQYHGEYVPMVWGHFGHGGNTTLTFPPGTRHVLGFNEPNNREQANMSPQEAARLWKVLESQTHGIKLVSPAPYRCHNTSQHCIMDSFAWYDQFFAACHDCRVDALAAHSYTCHAHQDLSYLGSLYNKYHLKVWLTEFSCPQTSDEAKIESYMREVVPLLDKAPYVERYAWFISRGLTSGYVTPAVSLLEPASSHTTTLGNLYNHL